MVTADNCMSMNIFPLRALTLLAATFVIATCSDVEHFDAVPPELSNLLALTIQDQVLIYSKASDIQIQDSSAFFALESSLLDNLSRAVYLLDQKRLQSESRKQVEHMLERAKGALIRNPIRRLRQSHGSKRQFNETEPILPPSIDVFLLLDEYFSPECFKLIE